MKRPAPTLVAHAANPYMMAGNRHPAGAPREDQEMSARPREAADKIDSLVKGLPDDVVRLRLIQSLADVGGQAKVADVARKISAESSGEAARAIIAAAKDGLVQFTDENNSVRITELGTKLADRQGKIAY